jgi:hypothetical protein
MVDPGAGTEDGMPPGVDKVGLVPAAAPLFMPVVLLPPFVPVVPVPVALLALPEEPAAPVAAAPPPAAPPPVPPPACASARVELIARIEAKTAVVIFMGIPLCLISIKRRTSPDRSSEIHRTPSRERGIPCLTVRCLGCDTHQTLALHVVRRPKATS